MRFIITALRCWIVTCLLGVLTSNAAWAQAEPAQAEPVVPAATAPPTTTTPPIGPAATDATDATDASGPRVPVADVANNMLPSSLDQCAAIAAEETTTSTNSNAPPVQWTKWELTGKFVDAPDVARALFDPYLKNHPAITASVRTDLAELARTAGYYLVGLGTRELASGDILVSIGIVPLPLVRRVDIAMNQSFFAPLLEQDVRRRMKLRVGAHISWAPRLRKCETLSEQQRIEEFLRDEGFFDVKASVRLNVEENGGAYVDVNVRLGTAYQLGKIRIEHTGAASVSDADIRKQFAHRGNCIIAGICFGKARFTRSQHQTDVHDLVELFHRRGFPAVRVQSDFDPKTSFDRVRKVVNFTLRIDERRRLDVAFEGHDPDRIQEAKLRAQVTFNQAGTSDDIEAKASASQLTQYLQSRGYFDARVTWVRKPETEIPLDRITFRLETGEPRRVNAIEFVGNQELTAAELLDAIGTREYSQFNSIFGENPAATATQLNDDAERIRTVYRKAGFRAAVVTPFAAPTLDGTANVGQSVTELALNNGEGQLAVMFRVEEGPVTLLNRLEFQLDVGQGFSSDIALPEARTLCDSALAITREVLGSNRHSAGVGPVVDRAAPNRCVVELTDTRYQEDVFESIPTQLLDRLQQQGRRNVKIDYAAAESGPQRRVAVIKISNLGRQRFGKTLLRGNFRTRPSVIMGELGFSEGALLSTEQIAAGAARLRATGLFEAVKIDFLDNDAASRNVNAIVRVEERYEKPGYVDGEGGYSFLNGGLFIKFTGFMGNLGGLGISSQVVTQWRFTCLDVSVDCVKWGQAEGNVKVPRWLWRRILPIEFDSDFSAFYRSLPTPRFGELKTIGASVSASRSNLRTRTESHPARIITYGLRYDFRSRDRQENALRPAGAGADNARLPVTTNTGAIVARVEWEQRVDRRGVLAPLGPEAGFRFEASAALAHPWLLGQATFVKLSGSLQRYQSIGQNLILRTDLRYDHGIPLGGAALLPDVERFFSGGDTTVRGYAEDSLATDVITSPVPPFSNVEQLHVRPAGGNIRGLTSVDAQLRIFGALASAVFVDAGVVTNRWRDVDRDKVRIGVGMALARVVTGFGSLAVEYAVPLSPRLGDDPRGRWHIGFAMRF